MKDVYFNGSSSYLLHHGRKSPNHEAARSSGRAASCPISSGTREYLTHWNKERSNSRMVRQESSPAGLLFH